MIKPLRVIDAIAPRDADRAISASVRTASLAVIRHA
jgi:hypothetical protein